MVTLDELARKGKEKLEAKLETMKATYEKVKDVAIANYEKLPFGPTRKAAYRKAWTYMPEHYKAKMTPEAVEKWERNWKFKMSI